jgi:hypothetical protein
MNSVYLFNRSDYNKFPHHGLCEVSIEFVKDQYGNKITMCKVEDGSDIIYKIPYSMLHIEYVYIGDL